MDGDGMILSIKNLIKTFPKDDTEMIAVSGFQLDVKEGSSSASWDLQDAARPQC